MAGPVAGILARFGRVTCRQGGTRVNDVKLQSLSLEGDCQGRVAESKSFFFWNKKKQKNFLP
jgi:hypothetical protein